MFDAVQLVEGLIARWWKWREDRIAKNTTVPDGFMDVKRVKLDKGELEIMGEGDMVWMLAEQSAKMLNMANAKNYIQVDLRPRLDRGARDIRVTVAWADGESPAAQNDRLKEELAAARAEITRLKTDLSGERAAMDMTMDLMWPGGLPEGGDQ
jgi:hypothetical protein